MQIASLKKPPGGSLRRKGAPVKPEDGMAECLHCGSEFRPRRRGHVFCSSFCRHRGERWDRPGPADREQIARLFDPSRDPNERVRDDDWHPSPGPWQELDWCQTVGTRRRWYRNLLEAGDLSN
jgi:hypothetical protein